MMFMLEIWGWFGLFVVMVILLLIAGKITIIAGYILCKLLWLAINSISQFLRKNVHLFECSSLDYSKEKEIEILRGLLHIQIEQVRRTKIC